jgi:putative copper export protein
MTKEFTFPETGGMVATNYGCLLLIAAGFFMFLVGIELALFLVG